MKATRFYKLISVIAFSLFAIIPTANAGIISVTLGNGASGLSDGDSPALFPTIQGIQSGQVAPFDAGIGSELFGNASNVNWTFNYAAITDTILSATFSFGILDHDSAASGSQLEGFSLDGTSQLTELDTLFEAGGGATDGQYKIYDFNLTNSFFTNVADGLFSVDLDIGGKGLQTALFGGAVSETGANGFHLIYSTLSITTQDSTDPEPVPEPSTLLLLVAGMAFLRNRKNNKSC